MEDSSITVQNSHTALDQNEVYSSHSDTVSKIKNEGELYRGFNGLMAFTFCFTVVSVLPSLSIGLDFGLNTGGSGVIIWGWIIGSFFNILVGLSLSEICSTYPNAGSVYYWTGILAPDQYGRIASYICGWFSFFGNVGGTAAFAAGFASIMNAAIALNNPGTNSTEQYGINDVPNPTTIDTRIQTAVAIGVVILWSLQNILRIDQQGWLNNLAAFIQISATISIIVTLFVVAKNRASAYTVFFSTINETGFSFPYVCLIGILPTLFSFSGYEAASHLCEEIRNAELFAPIGIVCTCLCASISGFIYLLALMFASDDPLQLVENTLNPSATVQIYQINTPAWVALFFSILLVLTLYFAGMSATTAASRTAYALARDDLFPGSKWLKQIYKRTQTPILCVLFVLITNMLLLSFNLFSSTAFAAIVSISTIGFQISYFLPIFFRVTSARKNFPRGKFHLGRFSMVIGIASVIWLFVTSVILLFPFNYPITAENMNWCVVVLVGVSVFATVYWLFCARHRFIGPKRTDQLSDSKAAKMPAGIPLPSPSSIFTIRL